MKAPAVRRTSKKCMSSIGVSTAAFPCTILSCWPSEFGRVTRPFDTNSRDRWSADFAMCYARYARAGTKQSTGQSRSSRVHATPVDCSKAWDKVLFVRDWHSQTISCNNQAQQLVNDSSNRMGHALTIEPFLADAVCSHWKMEAQLKWLKNHLDEGPENTLDISSTLADRQRSVPIVDANLIQRGMTLMSWFHR